MSCHPFRDHLLGYSRAWWRVSVRINAPAARGGLRTAATAAKCHRAPVDSHRVADQMPTPFDEPTTSTARRVAAATWMMSSTTVASRAYAVVPARRSRWSRGGASRPSSAPAAGSARPRRAQPRPTTCIVPEVRRGFRARAAPSTRHRWCPRPDQWAALVAMSLQELAYQILAPPVQFPFEFALAHAGREEGFGIREDSIGRYRFVIRHRTRTPRECPEGSAPEGDRPTVFFIRGQKGPCEEEPHPPVREDTPLHTSATARAAR